MPLSKFLKSSQIPKVLFIGLLYQTQPAWAAQCTTAPECLQNGTEGFIGGTLNGVSIQPSVPNPSSFDTTRFTSTTGYELWVTEDIRGVTTPNSPYAIVEKMFFAGDSNNAQRMDVTFFSSITEGGRLEKDTGEARSLETSQLNLSYVNFETTPSLKFFGTDNQINLIDSRVFFRASPQFISNAPFTINVNDVLGSGTESSFFNFRGNYLPQQTTINIANQNTLTFDESGSLSPFAVNSERLYFAGPVTGNVDDGTLKIKYSNVYFNSTDFNFINNGTLDLFGSDTKAEFEKLSFATGSQMVLSNNTTVTASDLYLDNATIDLESGAKVNADTVYVNGPATLGGPGINGAGINTAGFYLADNQTFTQNSAKVVVSQDLLLRSGAVLNITGGEFSAKTTSGYGGTVAISNGGEFVIAGGFNANQRDATFNVGASSFLRVASNAELTLAAPLAVNNDGVIIVDGFLSGSGTISGNGEVRVAESGQIAPGDPHGNKIGTILFDNAVVFDNFVNSGNKTNQNQYWADIDVVGGTATSDLLQYDDQSFDITNLESIGVNTASGRTADDLDGQFFTIISSLDAGSTGTLLTVGSYPTIVEGGDVPALVDFTIINNSTNGNDDVTLLADKQLDHLLKHPSIKSTHTLATAATTTVDPGTGQATTTVVTLIPAPIPAQTIPTGSAASTSTTVVDPSTGNTISTEVALVPDPAGGDGHQQTIVTTVTDSNGAVVGQSTDTKLLKGADTQGTAHKVVTVTTTDSGGSVLSSTSSTSTLEIASGSNNKTAGANLLLNSANAGNSQTLAALSSLTNNQVASHVDSIHAEPYSSYITVSLEHSDAVMNTVLNHAAPDGVFSSRVTQEEGEQQAGKRFWMDASYADGKVDGSGDLGDFGYTLSSLTIGQDKMDSGDRTLGAYFSFGTQKMNEHDSATQNFSSETYHFGLYLNQVNIGAWDLRGVLGYAFSDHESKRQVNLSSSSAIVEADFNSHSAYAGVKGTLIGYENNWVALAPELGFSYIYYLQESIKESGDANLSLSIDSAEAHAIIASAGLNARFTSLSDTMNIYPFAFSRFEHDFYANDNSEHEIDAALVAHPDYKQSFVGQNRGENAMVLGVGLGSVLSSALQINGGFDYSTSNHSSEWGAGFNLEYYW